MVSTPFVHFQIFGGATGMDPGEAQGYGLAVDVLQEYYVTWFVPYTFVFEG